MATNWSQRLVGDLSWKRAATKTPKLHFWVDRAGHNELADWDPVGYRRAIGGFVKLLGGR